MTPAHHSPPATADRRGRIGAALVVVALVVFVAGVLWALAGPGVSYGWQRSMISDLGAVGCNIWNERWVCSPRHTAFGVTQAGAGALLLVAAVLLWRRWDAALAVALASAGAGLVLLGAFPSDSAHTLHMVGAVVALPVAGVFLLLSGARREGTGPASRRWTRVVLATITLLLSALHLVPGDALRGIAELVSLVTLCAAFLLDAGWTLRLTPRGGGTPATPRPTRRSARSS